MELENDVWQFEFENSEITFDQQSVLIYWYSPEIGDKVKTKEEGLLVSEFLAKGSVPPLKFDKGVLRDTAGVWGASDAGDTSGARDTAGSGDPGNFDFKYK